MYYGPNSCSPDFKGDVQSRSENSKSTKPSEGILGKIKNRINGEAVDSVFNSIFETLGDLQAELKAKNKPSRKEICKHSLLFHYLISHYSNDGTNGEQS